LPVAFVMGEVREVDIYSSISVFVLDKYRFHRYNSRQFG